MIELIDLFFLKYGLNKEIVTDENIPLINYAIYIYNLLKLFINHIRLLIRVQSIIF